MIEEIEQPLSDPGRRPRNPVVTRTVVETIQSITAEAGFWPAARIASAIGWHPEDLERMATRHNRLKRLKRRADAACAARLAEVITERGMNGDKSAAAMLMKNQFGWSTARAEGGLKPSDPQRSALGTLFDDLGAEAE